MPMTVQEQLQALADGTMSVTEINTTNLSPKQASRPKKREVSKGSGAFSKRYKATVKKFFTEDNLNGRFLKFYTGHLNHRSSDETFPALIGH